MLFLIIAIILSLIIIFGFAAIDDWEFTGWMLGILAGVLVFFLGLGLAVGISSVIGDSYYDNNVEMESTLQREYSLIALEDNQKAYIYRYNSSDKLEYTFMYKTEKGYRTKTISGEYAYIIEIPEDKTPIVKQYENKFTNFWKNFIAICPDETFIYVPEGTIVENININLE